MLTEELEKAWRAREAAVGVSGALEFGPEGLTLGAGTVLAKTGGRREADADTRLEALLAVAYGEPAAKAAMGHVRAAVNRWDAGDHGRARLHLALARLRSAPPPRETARRLFLADELMRRGVAPEMICNALEAMRSAGLTKYSPDQPRVPAGSGRASGQWSATGGSGGPSLKPARGSTGAPRATSASSPAARALSAADLAVDAGAMVGTAPAGLGWADGPAAETISHLRFLSAIADVAPAIGAADLAGPFIALGVMFVPSRAGPARENGLAWVDVGSPNQLKYSWSPDETTIRVSYRDTSGQTRTQTANLGPGGDFRDPDGKPIAKLIKGVGAVVSLAALSELRSDNDDKPKLCPNPPVPDRNGAKPADRDYEDWVKLHVNPDQPTPRAMGYALKNPSNRSGLTIFDDCEQRTGTMVEAKKNYATLIDRLGHYDNFYLRKQWLDQSKAELDAAPDRPIVWFFNDRRGANYARKIFDEPEDGRRRRIKTFYLPMKRHKR